MLVSVAIVALMMVLFAQVFSLAGSSVGRQKGIARHDSRTRTILNILRNDLNDRTFKTVIPFYDGESDVYGSNDPRRFDLRRGFFYISENDPASATDDVLQFVIQVKADDPVFGRAEPYSPTMGDPNNVPELDDGQSGNDSGSSQYAIVSYFLRYGVLCRRVLLVRKPLDQQAEVTPSDWATDWPTTTRFWELFDYSAHYDTGTNALVWHGVTPNEDWLDNDPTNNLSLGNPQHRFGHNFGGGGNPREFDDNDVFFGRFTHQETSDPDFDWPMNGDTMNMGNRPFDPTDVTVSEVLVSGVIEEYKDGPRRAEDILMQHVHEFDVKVFDDGLGQFVDIGGTQAVDFSASNNVNGSNYRSNAPGTSGRNIFDTWHPGLGEDPPYRPDDGAASPTATPLRAVQIRLRFFDPESGQMRQMTLRHSLLPE